MQSDLPRKEKSSRQIILNSQQTYFTSSGIDLRVDIRCRSKTGWALRANNPRASHTKCITVVGKRNLAQRLSCGLSVPKSAGARSPLFTGGHCRREADNGGGHFRRGHCTPCLTCPGSKVWRTHWEIPQQKSLFSCTLPKLGNSRLFHPAPARSPDRQTLGI